MGEIPEETHEKINIYNKYSERPLNVSKAIENCIAREVKKLESELVAIASNDEMTGIYVSDESFELLRRDVEEGELGPKALLRRLSELVEAEGNDIELRALYPIDRVNFLENMERIDFYVKNVLCISVSPSYSDDFDLDLEEYDLGNNEVPEKEVKKV